MGKLVPPVTIELDKPRTLVCDMAAVQQFEEWSGVDFFALIETGKDDPKALAKSLMSIKNLNALLAACLLREDPEMTPRKAGQLVDSIEAFAAVSKSITEAFQRFFGVPDEAPAGSARQDAENPSY